MGDSFAWMENANRSSGVCPKCKQPMDDHTWRSAEAIVKGEEPFQGAPRCPTKEKA